MATDYAQPDQSVEEEETPKEPQLPSRKCSNLYSEAELARNISDYVNDCACQLGYEGDTFYSNIRILLSTVACAIGLFASIWLPYPESKEALILAIVMFFSVMAALFFIDVFVVQGAAGCVRDSEGRPMFICVGVDTKEATAVLALRREGSCLSDSIPLGKCFDTEGYLLTDNISAALENLFNDFEKGVTDDSKKAGKKKK